MKRVASKARSGPSAAIISSLYSRRTIWSTLTPCCWTAWREDEARQIEGREQTVGELLAIERQHLLPLVREGFDLAEVSFGQVNGLGCVKARTNAYSAPLPPDGQAQLN